MVKADNTTGLTDPAEILTWIRSLGLKIVEWGEEDDGKGDAKGPREAGWVSKIYEGPPQPGRRYGTLLGNEISPGRFPFDIDIDWSGGMIIAKKLLLKTGLIFGHASKSTSHAIYTSPEPIPSKRFEAPDGTVLLELRCAKTDGTVGLQTMVPPSVWSKNGTREPLLLVRRGELAHFPSAEEAIGYARLVAITMLLAKAMGRHGFGHEVRLAWAGYFLRHEFKVTDLERMGEALSVYCENDEIGDVHTTLVSTEKTLAKNGLASGGPSLARMLGDTGPAVIARIEEWLGRGKGLQLSRQGLPLRTQENVRMSLVLSEIKLSYNEFLSKALMAVGPNKPAAIEDDEVSSLRLRIDREFHLLPEKEFFNDIILDVARENKFHPVRDWLATLKWDGISRLSSWLTRYGGAEETDYTSAIGRIVLIAAVRRVHRPGCKFDEILVLESPQGRGKSLAVEHLCHDEAWFSATFPFHADPKEIIEATGGKWIIEVSELAGKNRAHTDQIKAMLSRQVDGPIRKAFGRLSIEVPRQFILIGTVNPSTYLADFTGGRRFWPVTIEKFDIPLLISERDQLWAEAVVAEKAGESIRLDESLWSAAAKEQEERREADAWEAPIDLELSTLKPGLDGKRRIITRDLFVAVGIAMDRRDRFASSRISGIMHSRGFKNTKIREGNVTFAGYVDLNVFKEAKKKGEAGEAEENPDE